VARVPPRLEPTPSTLLGSGVGLRVAGVRPEPLAFLEVLEYAGKLTIVVALITYILSADERKRNAENQRRAAEDQRKAKYFQAWQVINAAQGKGGDGGRAMALNELANSAGTLAGINVDGAQTSA
jgi:hypothetical protein